MTHEGDTPHMVQALVTVNTELGPFKMKVKMVSSIESRYWQYGIGAMKITVNQGHSNLRSGKVKRPWRTHSLFSNIARGLTHHSLGLSTVGTSPNFLL